MGVEHSMKDRLQVLGSRFQEILRSILNFPCTWHLAPGTSSRASRGFTLLLAALVGSIVLAMGSAIFSIALKQVTLSSIGKNSQFAFYAADTAAECALFWDFRADIHPNTFATSSASATPGTVTCDQKTVSLSYLQDPDSSLPNPSTSAATTTFSYDITTTDSTGNPKTYCADVSVAKYRNAATNGVNTVIYANGYSASCGSKSTNRDALQRSVELRY